MRIIIIVLLCFFYSKSYTQNIYTVCNLSGYVANYNDLQKALDSVPNGSIIYIHPSSIPYGNIIIKKRVILYGNGYFLGQNQAPYSQANVLSSSINSIFFKPGSEGSLLSGISFPSSSDPQITLDTVSNITIERSYFGTNAIHFVFNSISNIIFRQSYISGVPVFGIDNSNLFYVRTANPGVKFQNNIINGGEFGRFSGNYSTIYFDHNTISTFGVNFNFANSVFTNNILIKQTKPNTPADTVISIDGLGSAASSSSKNITNYSNIFNNTINRLVSRNTTIDSLVITRLNSNNITSDDGYFIVKNTSVAKNYSIDNSDCGAFGGEFPYVLSGIPPIPNIYYLNISENATINGGIKISIKAKANN
jgi:hypothetical protein